MTSSTCFIPCSTHNLKGEITSCSGSSSESRVRKPVLESYFCKSVSSPVLLPAQRPEYCLLSLLYRERKIKSINRYLNVLDSIEYYIVVLSNANLLLTWKSLYESNQSKSALLHFWQIRIKHILAKLINSSDYCWSYVK